MASDVRDRAGSDTPTISFALDALAQDADGRVEVIGRWFGIRGRRFVRPTLTAVLKAGGEQRSLADLDHKPWATEDGESWTAAFQLGAQLEEASELELNVAPDITVPLGPEATTRTSGASGKPKSARGGSSPDARAPRVRSNPTGRPTISDRSHEIERLRNRLADLEAAHDRERRRREQAESHLEDERTEALRLRSEVGRLGAELDLAGAARTELEAAAAELEKSRHEARSTGQKLEVTRHEVDQTGRQLKKVREHARSTDRALESARSETLQQERRFQEARRQLEAAERDRDGFSFALEQEQAETARLRRELADAEDAVRRLAGSRSGTVSRARSVSSDPDSADASAETGGETYFPGSGVSSTDHRLEPMSPRLRALNKLEGSTPPWADRPLNPSLRSPGNWAVRGLAVIVVLIVLAVVVVLINSTVG